MSNKLLVSKIVGQLSISIKIEKPFLNYNKDQNIPLCNLYNKVSISEINEFSNGADGKYFIIDNLNFYFKILDSFYKKHYSEEYRDYTNHIDMQFVILHIINDYYIPFHLNVDNLVVNTMKTLSDIKEAVVEKVSDKINAVQPLENNSFFDQSKMFGTFPDGMKAIVEEPSILIEANNIVNGDRNDQYGDPKEAFDQYAKILDVTFGITLSPSDICKVLLAIKMGRLKFKYKRDSAVDLCGYTYILDKLENGKEPS